ncbi:MAG TPA: hypothetical protein VJT31_26045 [Rugosimonospora sp.]|nr:hypothetical protein [Rugosimonospora sp.]
MRRLLRGRFGQVLVAIVIAGAAVALAVGVSKMAYPTVASYPDTNAEAGRVEADPSSSTARIVLSADAAHRIGVRTVPVSASQVAGRAVLSVPVDAIFYDPEGDTYVYVTREPLRYTRERVTVDTIAAGVATLTAGPPAGTQVVTVGVAELYGIEVGVGEE